MRLPRGREGRVRAERLREHLKAGLTRRATLEEARGRFAEGMGRTAWPLLGLIVLLLVVALGLVLVMFLGGG